MSGRNTRGAWLLALFFVAAPARGDRLDVTVRDRDGGPVENAVVSARRLDRADPPNPKRETVIVDQIDKEYVPYVTAIRVGTAVSFPNKDQIRHHVYSFSPAKKFEIPLYKGTPADPVVFDTPGTVVLGCNIHDWMKAYIFVSPTPYFAVTPASGDASIELPPGEYAVEVWHPELSGDPAALEQRVTLAGGASALGFTIERKTVWSARRAPSREGAGGYR